MKEHIQSYVIHDDTGRIVRTLFCPERLIHLQVQTGEGYVLGKGDFDKHRVENGQIVERLKNPAILKGNKIHNVEIPSKLHIDNNVHDVKSKVVDLQFSHSGAYRVRLESFPFQDAHFDVEVK